MGATSHYKYHKVLQHIWKFLVDLFFEEGFRLSQMTTVITVQKDTAYLDTQLSQNNVGVVHLHTSY